MVPRRAVPPAARPAAGGPTFGSLNRPETEMMSCVLAIDRALLRVRLGCEAEERVEPRDVEVDLRIWFRRRPRGCSTDRLEDVVCYAELIEKLQEAVAGREFHLVERLTMVAYETLRPLIPADAGLWLRLRKLRTPIPALAHGVSFAYGERPPEEPGSFTRRE